VFAIFSSLACSERVEVGSNAAGGASASAGMDAGGAAGVAAGSGGMSGGSGGAAPTAGAAPCEPAECLGKAYLCGNCEDDDGEGLIDALDPDCLGPCDNTEDSYYGGIPGQNNAPCRQDCYFDRDSGSGNDRCEASQVCDPLSLAPDFPPSGDAACAYDPSSATSGQACADPQSQSCRDFCLPLTPNGCDCFGCCELPARSANFVWIGSETSGSGTCDAMSIADPAACRPCTPVPTCFNGCEACEVCVGSTTPGPGCGSAPECGTTSRACNAVSGCSAGEYCITGCCIPVPR
jgi:hypothetical protein